MKSKPPESRKTLQSVKAAATKAAKPSRKSRVKAVDRALIERIDRIAGLLDKIGPEVLGNRIRRLRDQQGLSIRVVAEQAGISKNSIVRMEQGRGTQAVTVLKVCNVLGVHVERLAEPASDDMTLAITHRKKDNRWFDAGDMGSKPLLKVSNRELTPAERKRAVAQGAQSPINLLQCRLPGGRVLPSILEVFQKSPERSHVGEEFAYILSGTAIITVGGKKHRLNEGESITFWSAEPHTYAPADAKKVPVRILSVRIDGQS